jgi:aryl-alcohol dehydrogenase-like predicted oxidoreductase
MNLGSQGLVIPTIGLGCMGMSKMNGAGVYGKADDKESIATIHRSFDLGGNFLDTADIYGLVRTRGWWQRLCQAIGINI